MSIFEYDEEKELRLIREAEREYGIEIGTERGIEIGTKRGTEKERNKNIKIIMKKMNLTKVEAMEFLEVPKDDYNNNNQQGELYAD